jgi:hypothetical protein
VGGGGEWGAKSSLLSLDPKTSHTPKSETDELERFIRSFNGDEDAKDAIAQPGNYVQFFVERDPKQDPPEIVSSLKHVQGYPPVRFGCGDMHMRDIDQPDRTVLSRRRDRGHTEQLYSDHFGAYSAEGIYVSSGGRGPNTKMDVPGATVTMATDQRPKQTYRSFMRPSLNSWCRNDAHPAR